MGIFDRTNYVELRRTASGERFSEVFGNVSRRKQNKLIDGAIEAFRNGQPENVRTLLVEPSTALETGARILSAIMQGVDDKTAVIESAFINATPGFKKNVLNWVLYNAVSNNSPAAEEILVAALLKSGADANAEHGGFAGSLLAIAVNGNRPLPVMRLLVENKASVEGALCYAYANTYTPAIKQTLNTYKTIAAEVSSSETEVAGTQVTMQQLQREMLELRKAVDLLPARIVEALNAADQNTAKTEAPAVSRAHLTLGQ